MRRRWVKAVLVGLCALAVLPACGSRDTDDEALREALEHTRRLSARFEYTDERPDRTITVQGLVEDDFRFKSRVFYDGEPGFDEVVSDDVLAMRILKPELLPELVNPDAPPTDQTTEIEGVDVVEALQSRRWVQDESAAPVVSGLGQTEDKLGLDPAIDAVTVIDYALEAMRQATAVRRYDPDSLSATYIKAEDPFEEPADGETRYDLVKPKLPAPSEATSGAGGEVALPATKHFRKMAVYVRDGKVVRIEERVEVTGKSLDSFVDWFDLFLREANATQSIGRFRETVRTTPRAELGAVLMGMLSERLRGIGAMGILVRSMSLTLEDHGEKIAVTLPEEQMVRGKLAALVTSGQSKKPETTGGDGTQPTGGDTGDIGGTGGGGGTDGTGGGTGTGGTTDTTTATDGGTVDIGDTETTDTTTAP